MVGGRWDEIGLYACIGVIIDMARRFEQTFVPIIVPLVCFLLSVGRLAAVGRQTEGRLRWSRSKPAEDLTAEELADTVVIDIVYIHTESGGQTWWINRSLSFLYDW